LLKPPRPYQLRPMQLSDIEGAMSIERLTFPMAWQATSFEYELSKNRIASYQVLTVRKGDHPAQLIGFSGYWIMAGEAHVSTIANHPDWRGRGLGELLFLNLLYLAYDEPAELVTLEVRAGNQVAQALYQKYNLLIVGERPRYYRDNREDALIMTVKPLDKEYRRFLQEMRKRLFERLAEHS
jgi:[ribosomal protein S18]-alanine N-acetyltransferase